MEYLFSSVIGTLPNLILVVVLVTGFILVAQRRARLGPRVVIFARAGLGLLTVNVVLRALWVILFPRLIMALDVRATGFGVLSAIVGLILTLLEAAGLVLLIVAIVSSPSTPGPEPQSGAYSPGYQPPPDDSAYRNPG